MLGDLSYIDENMLMMWRPSKVERPLDMGEGALTVDNKMHVSYCLRVEWGIVGLKWKFQGVMKWIDATKLKYNHLSRTATISTNFCTFAHNGFYS